MKLLQRWKAQREADGVDALAGLRDLTEARLAEMIATAQAQLLDRVGPALDEFGKSAPELATLLRVVPEELADPRVHGFGISPDSIGQLSQAAHALRGLEDHAGTLMNAASKMGNLADGASALQAATEIRAAALALQRAKEH
ncbi:hypothetical protein ACEZCY_16510 [Streptacidiphilus sp. N1-12]|uniref:Uncharacterized protein n=2 Tax=Streptacidiphilus alkalitolerans TaxID=3342712 RepID=A0ABV6WFL5_9ACTN